MGVLRSDSQNFATTDMNDVIGWNWEKNNKLTTDDNGPAHQKIWKGKIPAKIKIFMWLLESNAILTKDNMIKRKWLGGPKVFLLQLAGIH
jgi:hypothetical protein